MAGAVKRLAGRGGKAEDGHFARRLVRPERRDRARDPGPWILALAIKPGWVVGRQRGGVTDAAAEVDADCTHPHDVPVLIAGVMRDPVVVGAIRQLTVELRCPGLSLLAGHRFTIPLAGSARRPAVPQVAHGLARRSSYSHFQFIPKRLPS
jgi:hypothetical protein